VPLERRSLNELATLDVLGLERLAPLAEPLLLGAQLSAGRRAALGDGGCGRFLPRGSKFDNGPQFIARDFKEFIRIAGMTHVRISPSYPELSLARPRPQLVRVPQGFDPATLEWGGGGPACDRGVGWGVD